MNEKSQGWTEAGRELPTKDGNRPPAKTSGRKGKSCFARVEHHQTGGEQLGGDQDWLEEE